MNFAQTLRWGLVAAGLGASHLLGAGDDLAARVIILANAREPESVRLAEFYAEKRGVPLANIVALPLPETESITWREFIDQVYQPLQDELYHRGWIEGMASRLLDRLGRKRYALTGHRLSYLVVCRGVPLRIANDPALLDDKAGRKIADQFKKNEAAVDSELSLLAQSGYDITGTVNNPLFSRDRPSELDAAAVVKVCRLDGPDFADARRLVTSALAGESHGLLGRYYVDLQGPHPDGDQWLEATLKQLQELGFDGDVERTAATFDPAARFDTPVLYFGWYRSDLAGPFAVEGFSFPPGAVALHIHSYSAQTLHSATEGWCGPLVARGVTATVGNVFEPYLPLTHRPNLLLYALSHGMNFGDAVYFALPALSWQEVAIGDPLYRPFKVSLEQQEQQSGRLPPVLAPYAVIRRANLLRQKGRKNEALAVLKAGLKAQPNLALGLALARQALAENDAPAAVRALSLVVNQQQFDPGEWPLARESAALLAAHEAPRAALQVYVALARSKTPSPDALKALLIEARTVADAAGDRTLSAGFGRQLAELMLAPTP